MPTCRTVHSLLPSALDWGTISVGETLFRVRLQIHISTRAQVCHLALLNHRVLTMLLIGIVPFTIARQTFYIIHKKPAILFSQEGLEVAPRGPAGGRSRRRPSQKAGRRFPARCS